jgi:DNA modification methylase
MANRVQILQGDCREKLMQLPAQSVHCCVTSPPYWNLRDYGTGTWEGGDASCDHLDQRDTATTKQTTNAGTNKMQFAGTCGKCGAKRIDQQIGMEDSPQEFVSAMVDFARGVWHVLRDDGTFWLNLGDSYAADRGGTYMPAETLAGGISGVGDADSMRGRSDKEKGNARRDCTKYGLKHKDLCMIPARVAIALQEDGWYLRNDIIWFKPNPMPASVTDRCTNSYEHIFLLTKKPDYFCDMEAIREPASPASYERYEHGFTSANTKHSANDEYSSASSKASKQKDGQERFRDLSGKNKRDVWVVSVSGFSGAHFATFNPDLIRPCILAGTSAAGCCPKCGAPHERIIELGEPDLAHQRACGGDMFGKYDGKATKDFSANGVQDASAVKARILAGMRERKTVGWKPTCECNAGKPVPCTVIDPFGGSGTTGMVATELGRNSILIELNPAYVTLCENRTNVTPGLQL